MLLLLVVLQLLLDVVPSSRGLVLHFHQLFQFLLVPLEALLFLAHLPALPLPLVEIPFDIIIGAIEEVFIADFREVNLV